MHNLSSFLVNKIKNNYGNTVRKSGKQVGIGNIPFNHSFAFLAKFKEIVKKNPNIADENRKVEIKAKIDSGRASKGETAPAENQATAILPTTSDALSS